jgi:putative thioredoxin
MRNPPDMSLTASPVSVTITMENAQTLLLDESQQRLVVACFWAEASAQSIEVRQTLEKIATSYGGDFLLASVDAVREQMIARQLQIRSVPSVMLIKNGQPIDGFAGPLGEAQIREILDQHLPKPCDKQLAEAQLLIAEGKFSLALPLLLSAHKDSGGRSDIALALGSCYLPLNRLDELEALLGTIPMEDQDALYQQLLAQLHLKRTATKTPETEALENALAADPENLSLKMQLAVRYSQENLTKEALEHLIQILRKDKQFGDGEARKRMLDIFRSLGNQDPLVIHYQRQLFSLLY